MEVMSELGMSKTGHTSMRCGATPKNTKIA